MSDPVLTRTLLALLRSFAPTNAFLLARLSGHPERDVARVLAALEALGLAAPDNGRWTLTAIGHETCRGPHSNRPGSIAKFRVGRAITTGKRQ
jgi:hypothetical protein